MSDDTPSVPAIKPRLNLIRGAGPQLGGVPVKSIYSARMCEDGRTFLLLARLADGRMAAVNVEPGSPISVGIVEVEVES